MNELTIQELFDLTGQTALITGGTGHLGRSFANALAEAGANVVIGSRSESRAQQAASRLTTSNGQCHYGVELNQLDEASLNEGFDAAVRQAGQVDILINNAQQGHALDWTTVTFDAFSRDLQNAAGYFFLAKRLREHLVERQQAGNIVMVGSMYGVVGSYPDAYAGVSPANPVQYQVLKGGVIQLTRHLAVSWAADGIRVNCLSPGPFPAASAPSEMVERLKAKSPLKRMGQPHELKGALLLLVSRAGSYLTGQNLLVDGGWTAW